MDWCGMFQIRKSPFSIEEKQFFSRLEKIAATNNPIVLSRIDEDSIKASVSCIDGLRKVDYSIMEEEDFANHFLYLSINSGRIIEVDTDKLDSVMNELHKFREELSLETAAFVFEETEFYIHRNMCDDVPSDITLGAVCESSAHPNEISNSVIQGPYELKAMFRVSNIEEEEYEPTEELICEVSDSKIVHPPALQTSNIPDGGNKKSKTQIHLPINFLCVAQKERLVHSAYDILMEALYRWLDLVTLYLKKSYFKSAESTSMQISHFYPMTLSHYVTQIYSKDKTDESSVDQRAALHVLFNLTPTQPFFRHANVLNFGKRSIRLNVHHGLRFKKNVSEGQRALVKGTYEFFHYDQDATDDRGWGCAYRSFQTIFSWFRFQGYTNKMVPNHTDIQKCLVKIGDKPASFIGSRCWIGSTEISFCLDEMLGVNSIILSVSDGLELCTLGSQLLHHFRTAGTPVMIGGGNLAHTIIGVEFNEDSGDIMFLILDPHFVLAGDKPQLTQIQTKGGVFWKGVNFWTAKNFYNLCLPQPPSIF
ncbi:UFM1 specific peptidase 2 isoform X2 [Rhodnius prolixus]